MQTYPPQPLAPPDKLPLFAGSFAICLGTLVLIGWFSNALLLATGLPDLPATHPLSALWLLLVGCAVVLLNSPTPDSWPRRSAVLLLSLVLLTAILTFGDSLFSSPVGNNQWLLQIVPSIPAQLPDSPPPHTAVSVGCLCIALMFRAIAPQRGMRVLALLLTLPTLLPLLALVGQLYHLLALYTGTFPSAMSLPTALSLLVLSGGTVALYPECRLMRFLHSPGQEGVLARRLLPVSLGVPLFFGAAATLGQRLGWYDTQGTLPVVTLSIIMALLVVSWRSVTTMRTMDRERMEAAQRSQRLANQRQRLLEVAQSLLTTPDVDAILSRVQESVAAVVAFDGFGLYWLDAAAGLLHPAITVVTERNAKIEAVPLPLDRGIAAMAIQTGQGELINDAHHDPRSFYPAGAMITLEHLICLPLRAHEQTLGVFLLARYADPPFTNDEFELVQLFIGYASLALANARLYEQATASAEQAQTLLAASERQAQELALMGQVRTALARELDLPVMFRTVVEAIAATFGYTQVSLYTLADDGLHLQHQVGYDQVISHIPLTAGISGWVVRTRQPVLLEDVRADPAFLGAIEGIVSEVCVPLFDDDQVVGMLNVESTQGVRLSTADLQLMVGLSEHVGIAIGRARLYTAQKQAAIEREKLIAELREALANIRTLRGLLPICASCKKIRDDTGYWNQLETYLQRHAEVAFSHGICPDCVRKLYPDIADELDLTA